MAEYRDVVEQAAQARFGCHADEFAQAVQLPLLLVAGPEKNVGHVVVERVAGAEWRVHRLDVDAELRVPLPQRREQLNRPLGPMLLGRYVDVLYAELGHLADVCFVARADLGSDIHGIFTFRGRYARAEPGNLCWPWDSAEHRDGKCRVSTRPLLNP